MNGYERYTRIMKGEQVDYLPRTPILMQYAAEYIGSDYAAFASDYRILTKSNVECAKEFGFDQLSCISDPYRETQGFGSTIEYVKDGPPRSSHPLAETKDLSVISKPDPTRSDRMRDRINAVDAYRRDFQGEYSILGWIEGPAAEAADLRGVITFLIDLLDDDVFAGELMDLCVDVGIAFARAQIEAGVDTVGMGDAIASQIDPRTYERLIQPREKRIVKAIHNMGALAKLHICGNITHLLPGISDLGVDIIDVDHMVSMAAVREAVGREVAISGNMDPVSVVMDGTPDEIRKAIADVYAEVGNPYIVNAGCEIPARTPVENLRALCEPVPYES
ncbi:MAG: uroporphyrinogen decarboxylase family protein [Lentisphaerae bacterium]|nr:uroporphyrinogen decarboxylase family protein [Lentisphaerota bacterium]